MHSHERSSVSTNGDDLSGLAEARLGRYVQIVESTLDAIIACNADDTIEVWNRAAETLYGYSAAEAIGASIELIIAPDRKEELPAILSSLSRSPRAKTYESIHVCKNGTPVEVAVSASLLGITGRETEGFALVVRDLVQQKAHQEQNRQRSLHDALTGLPNRTLFEDRVEQRLLAIDVSKETMAVMVLDLDGFREINNARGHAFGDTVLEFVAERLQDSLKESETVARLAGNTFAVLLPFAGNVGAIDSAGTLLSTLEHPFEVDGETVYLTAGIGISVYPAHGADISTLLRKADAAMNTAKREGSGYAFYADGIDVDVSDRLALLADLRRAIKRDELVLHYQPQINLDDGCGEHAEALLRWNHPTRGLLTPDHFIGIAESAGLIRPLTYWVLNAAFRQSSEWHRRGIDVNIAVNLSAWNVHDRELIQTVLALLGTWDVEPDHFTIEITESALMIDPARALTTLSVLHDMGMRISIDDFGTGYSSMGYLQRLPIDEIKVDRSFVAGIQGAYDDSAIIVRSIIDLGHNLGLDVIAEGVESQQQLDVLAPLGCDMVQGYYVSVPLPSDDYEPWLRGHVAQQWAIPKPFAGHGTTGTR